MQDTINCKAGLYAIERALKATGSEAGIAISGTIETMGTMLAGQDIEAFYTSLAHHELLWIGLNCATGPEFMTDHLRTLAEISRFAVACVPNAGLPDEDGHYLETPEMLARKLDALCREGLDQPGRRLLRHHAGAHPRARQRWPGSIARASRRRRSAQSSRASSS